MTEEKEHTGTRSGFISIIGRPNAGKSTLLNAILGEKLSIVSAKPQTTRNTIRGIWTSGDCQMVFVDTPGIHRKEGLLNEFMLKEALGMLSDVDVILYLVDASRKKVTAEDRLIIGELEKVRAPVVLGVNKIDQVEKPALLPLIEEYSGLFAFREIVPVSALTGDGLAELTGVLKSLLPEGPMYFSGEELTDAPERQIAAEIIREKVFIHTHQEVPYSSAVVVESFKERPGREGRRGVVEIKAVINVERDTQKAIVIGRRGAMLKKIGTEARLEIERFLGTRVYLEIFVRITRDWTRSPRAMKEFGY